MQKIVDVTVFEKSFIHWIYKSFWRFYPKHGRLYQSLFKTTDYRNIAKATDKTSRHGLNESFKNGRYYFIFASGVSTKTINIVLTVIKFYSCGHF